MSFQRESSTNVQSFTVGEKQAITLRTPVNECNREWVLKKSLNRTSFLLRVCHCRLSSLRSTRRWLAESVLSVG